MKVILRLHVCGILFWMMVLAPPSANACACCAEEGTWFEETEAIDDELAAIFGELTSRFDSSAFLYTTGAGEEGIRGISPLAESKKYTIQRKLPRSAESWLVITDEHGISGTLSFKDLDRKRVTEMGVDLRDGREGGGGGPLLYKELRFEGEVSGDGIFSKGINRGTKLLLIFQGRGNMCRNSADYAHWILQISGANADFSFYGSLKNSDSATVKYFSSPQEAVPIIADALRKGDWLTLARYYDRTGTGLREVDIQDSAFYLYDVKPQNVHPGLDWKYRQPFTPGFEFDHVQETSDPSVVRVYLKLEIDQGGRRTQRGLSEFKMRKSDRGYQLLSADTRFADREQTGGLTRVEAATFAHVYLEMERLHGYYCPSQESWYFVRNNGSGVVLRKIRIATNANALPGAKWENMPLSKNDTCR